jgi:hypothetical protein
VPVTPGVAYIGSKQPEVPVVPGLISDDGSTADAGGKTGDVIVTALASGGSKNGDVPVVTG